MNQQGLELSELINKVKLGLENAKYSDYVLTDLSLYGIT